jgi:hypothetical protein
VCSVYGDGDGDGDGETWEKKRRATSAARVEEEPVRSRLEIVFVCPSVPPLYPHFRPRARSRFRVRIMVLSLCRDASRFRSRSRSRSWSRLGSSGTAGSKRLGLGLAMGCVVFDGWEPCARGHPSLRRMPTLVLVLGWDQAVPPGLGASVVRCVRLNALSVCG